MLNLLKHIYKCKVSDNKGIIYYQHIHIKNQLIIKNSFETRGIRHEIMRGSSMISVGTILLFAAYFGTC